MTDSPLPRPRQATVSGWMIVGGSVALVLFAFQRMASLGSSEFQESVGRTLSMPPADGLGLSVDDVQSIVRVLCFVVAACGVTAAILGREALRASTSARLVLSVVAPVMFVAGLAVATLPAAFVGAGVFMLWTQPSRDWFAGRAAPPAPTPNLSPSSHPPPPTPPAPGFPAPPVPYGAIPPPPGLPGPWVGAPSSYPANDPTEARRPGVVLAACVITWVTCGLAALFGALTLLVVLLDRDGLLDELRRDGNLERAGVSDHAFVVSAVTTLSVLVPWCLGAAVVAVFVARRVTWAWVVLVVSASIAALLCLAAMFFGGLVAIVPLAACAGSASLLMRPESRGWFARRPRP